jgi:hypothetical protein
MKTVELHANGRWAKVTKLTAAKFGKTLPYYVAFGKEGQNTAFDNTRVSQRNWAIEAAKAYLQTGKI